MPRPPSPNQPTAVLLLTIFANILLVFSRCFSLQFLAMLKAIFLQFLRFFILFSRSIFFGMLTPSQYQLPNCQCPIPKLCPLCHKKSSHFSSYGVSHTWSNRFLQSFLQYFKSPNFNISKKEW